ncbi:hypothetical protein BCU68_00760 [Vibrio sp. 10N.286.49.B3]|nr:hypothetical protein BCU68_00760 [Vibrio sp. 10N.286.49.B3]
MLSKPTRHSISYLFLILFGFLFVVSTAHARSIYSCQVTTHNDFELTWSVDGYDQANHNVLAIQGFTNRSQEIFWLSGNSKQPNTYFYDDALFALSDYLENQYRLNYDADLNQFSYSKRIKSRGRWGEWTTPQIVTSSLSHNETVVFRTDHSNADDQWRFTSLHCQQAYTPPTRDAYCEYFPEPIQPWSKDSSLFISNVAGEDITGWSSDYLTQYKTTVTQGNKEYDAVMTGYSGSSLVNNVTKNSCGAGGVCSPFSGDENKRPLAKTPHALEEEFISGLPLLTFQGYNSSDPDTHCETLANACSYDLATQTLTMRKSVFDYNINVYYQSGAPKPIRYIIFESSEGQPLFFNSFDTGSDLNLRFRENNAYTFSELNFGGGGLKVVETESHVVLNIVNSLTQRNPVSYQDVGDMRDLFIYGPGADITIHNTSTDNENVYAFIVADNLELSNKTNINGGITANHLKMTNGSKVIGTGYCYDRPAAPSDEYFISVQQVEQMALTCQSPQIQFLITDQDGNPSALPSGTVVELDHEFDRIELVPNYGSQVGNSYQPNPNGELWFTASHDKPELDVALTAKIKNSTQDSDATTVINFVPYKFEVAGVNAIAGMKTNINAAVLSCNTNDKPIDVAYAGKPEIYFTLNFPVQGQQGSLAYQPRFSNGISSDDLTLSEVGSFTVNITDNQFNCHDYPSIDCPIDGGGDLMGRFAVNVKPWRFDICSPTQQPLNGTSSSGDKFAIAGEAFDLQIIPVRYQDKAMECDSSTRVNNYWLPISQYPNAAIALSHQLHSPVDGTSGVLSSAKELDRKLVDISESTFDELEYSEVGSMTLIAHDHSSFYSDLSVIPDFGGIETGVVGERPIGRFVPDYIAVTDTTWQYASKHHGFAYMGQGIGHTFAVQAFNKHDRQTRNYGLFSNGNVVDLNYQIYDRHGERITKRVVDKASSVSSFNDLSWTAEDWTPQGLRVEFDTFVFHKDGAQSNEDDKRVATIPDGPFLEGFKLAISNTVDGVDFAPGSDDETESPLLTQPHFRYGRAALQDINGSSGSTLTVPLKVEFWNGRQFETNSLDSGSEFSSANYCFDTRWHEQEGQADPLLIGEGQVLAGISNELAMSQVAEEGYVREQVQMWLRFGSESSKYLETRYEAQSCVGSHGDRPWLQYNWDNLGDGDPAALVTFGVYRGNDRVIFRGEARMTGY